MGTVLKHFFLLFAIWVSFTLAEESLPTIYGVKNEVNFKFFFAKISLPREFPRYNIKGHENASTTHEIYFQDSRLAVFSPDFCQTYNNLVAIWAESTSIEVILPGSFDDCPLLDWVHFQKNLIKELPADLFKNTKSLRQFDFDWNQLEKLPNNLLPDGDTMGVVPFMLRHNNYKEFPVNIFNEHRNTFSIHFSSNDATDLNAREITKHFPRLASIFIGDNLIPCSRIPGIKAEFAEFGVVVGSGVAEPPKARERQIIWASFEGISCVDDFTD